LNILNCDGNQLTSLDVTNNSSIGQDYAGYSMCYLSIQDMPDLEKVCVWTMLFPPEGVNVCTEGSPNVYFTTDCSNSGFRSFRAHFFSVKVP